MFGGKKKLICIEVHASFFFIVFGKASHKLVIQHLFSVSGLFLTGYVSVLKQYGIRISMTESGDPKENAQAERINNTMKNELLKDAVFHNIEEVRAAVSVAVNFYNNERPHMSIDMMTPAQAAGCCGEIAKRWTSYRINAIKSRPKGLDITEKGLRLPDCQATPSGLPPPVNP